MSFGTPPAVEFIQGRSTADRPIIPIVGTLAATINQIPGEHFLTDATHLANSLQRAQRLFELDAVCVVPDPTLIAEALGTTVEWNEDQTQFTTAEHIESVDALSDPNSVPDKGRVPIVVDAAERLATSLEDDVAVFGVLPGPFTTAEASFQDPETVDWERPIRAATGEVARALGQAGVDAFLVMESPGLDIDDSDAIVDSTTEILAVIDNISEFFGTPLAFAPTDYSPVVVERIVDQASLDAVFLNFNDLDELEFEDMRVGSGITPALLEAEDDDIERTIRERLSGFPPEAFLASSVEVPSNVHPRKVQAALRASEKASN